ncbi:MAG: hypothetical protein ACKO7W_09370 [Elainella sp.]
MATSTRNRPKTASVSKTAIDQVGSLLQDLSAKPKEEMSIREAIDQLREPIQSAMAKGYHYDDIIKILADSGISTTATTVKRYLSLSNPRRSKGKAAKPGRRAKPEPGAELTPEPTPEPASKPARKTRGAKANPVESGESVEKPTRGRRKATPEPASPSRTAKTTRGRKRSSAL